MNNIELEKMKKYLPEGSLTDEIINKAKKRMRNENKKPEVKIMNNKYKLNLKKDVHDPRDYKLNENVFKMPLEYPSKIDWTSTMSPVKDQGNLGSCVGFAVTAMKEWQEQQEQEKEIAAGKKYTREQDYYDLSEAWVYWNCKKIDPWPNEEGTSIRCAMQVLQKIGIPCEKAYPYSDKYKGSPESWAKLIAKWGLIDSYWRCNGIDDLKMALPNGPVVIGIACFREIFSVNETGNVPYPANPNEVLGGHAICVVGYDENTQKIKFKNSWTTSWGNNGYGFLSYRYINDFMWDGWIAKDLQVTKKILNERAKDELV